MDVTVYLPDEIRRRAKDEEINLSGMLRAAVEAELGRREATRESMTDLGEPQTVEVRVVENDAEFSGRITGWMIDRNGDWEVYLTPDDRVIVYNQFKTSYEVMTPAKARGTLAVERFPEALRRLGVEPVKDL